MDNNKEMTCTEEGCGGKIDTENQFLVPCGCTRRMSTIPCTKCGRLHHHDGTGVFNRGGQKAFVIQGELVNK